ncbi:MAG: hypothetical protein ACO3AV_10540 [Ilumatobacteraceae bacterium]|jgi:hypothetical protein
MNEQPDDRSGHEAVDVGAGTGADHSRRAFFSRTAMAAAAAAVAGVAIAHEAQAANGDTMFVGSANTATSSTTITGGSSLVVTGGSSSTVSGYPTSISGVATSGAGVAGTSTSGVGILATTEAGIGLQAEASSSFSTAIRAEAFGEGTRGLSVYVSGTDAHGISSISDGDNAVAIYGWHFGTGNPGTGVIGLSDTGIGVIGAGSTVDLQAAGTGRVLLDSAGTLGPTTAGDRGTIARDASGNFWTAVADDTWRKVSGPGTAGALHLLASPTRVYDSRVGKTPAVGTKAPLAGGSRSIDCTANSSGVPAAARGVIVNVTVLWSSASGYVAVTPGGAGDTGTSTANSPGIGGKTASLAIVACGTGARAGKIDVSAGPGGSFDFIVDVTGYFI